VVAYINMMIMPLLQPQVAQPRHPRQTSSYTHIMAPAVVDAPPADVPVITKAAAAATAPKPVKATGVLDQYESFDVTPVIGREFPSAKLVEWLNAPNSDELIRDLAVTSTLSHSPRRCIGG